MADNLFNLNIPEFWGLMIRFGITVIALFILIRVIYYRYSANKMFLFTFSLMGVVIYFIAAMMHIVFLDIGMAFGLFAIFTILRLRTKNFSVKDMSYMFTTIGLSVINSLKLVRFPLLGLLIINVIIILAAYLLEESMSKNKSESHLIIYDNLELLKSDKKQKILNELCQITGKEILKYKIIRVNYKRKIARIEIFYKV
jgi:hypothetical protein